MFGGIIIAAIIFLALSGEIPAFDNDVADIAELEQQLTEQFRDQLYPEIASVKVAGFGRPVFAGAINMNVSISWTEKQSTQTGIDLYPMGEYYVGSMNLSTEEMQNIAGIKEEFRSNRVNLMLEVD